MNGHTLFANALAWWTVLLSVWWTVWMNGVGVCAMPRPRNVAAVPVAVPVAGSAEVVNNKYDAMNSEPSCEELKAMWRFSKRQSRAAEITNEIPTYRDPFSYNVWEPYYARSRSIGGMRMGSRFRNRPVYGKILHKVPPFRAHDLVERSRAFEEVARLYGTVQRADTPRRRMTAFRLSGGAHVPQMGLTPQSGSFQHLKELIRTERARELQEQRMAEEVAARAAALKDISSGTTGNHDRHRQQNLRDNYPYDMDGSRDKQMSESMGRGSGVSGGGSGGGTGVLSFPDLLAPAARTDILDSPIGYVSDPQSQYMQESEYLYHDVPKHFQRTGIAPRRSMYSDAAYSDDLESELTL